VGLSGAASSATSALDAFMDMSADQLAAAAAAAAGGGGGGPGGLRGTSASGGAAAAAAAAAGFERYGLEHPAAAAAEGAEDEGDGEQQQAGGSKQVILQGRGCWRRGGGRYRGVWVCGDWLQRHLPRSCDSSRGSAGVVCMHV